MLNHSSALTTLSDVNRTLASTLINGGDKYTASKLLACRPGGFHPSFCKNSTRCTVCSWHQRLKHQRESYNQLSNSLTNNPGSEPVFLTLSTFDCQLDEIKGRNQHVQQSWKALFSPQGRSTPILGRKTLTAAGYIETVPTCDPDLYNAHLHAVLVMADGLKYGGRDYLKRFSDPDDQSQNDPQWMDFWQAASDTRARTAKVSIVRDLAAVLHYSFKSSSLTVIANDGSVKQPAYVDPVTNKLIPAGRLLLIQNQLSGIPRVLKYGTSCNQKGITR